MEGVEGGDSGVGQKIDELFVGEDSVVRQPECPFDQSHEVAGSVGKGISRPHEALRVRRFVPRWWSPALHAAPRAMGPRSSVSLASRLFPRHDNLVAALLDLVRQSILPSPLTSAPISPISFS
jgi:hypothetical protein